MADISPSELSQQCVDLSEEIQDKTRIVAEYEIAFRAAQTETKRAIAKFTVRQKGVATPSVLKIMADSDGLVIEAQDKEQAAFATLTIGKAETDGMTARFQALEKALDLKIEEIKAFRGGSR